MACQGAEVIVDLVGQGLLDPEDWSHLEKPDREWIADPMLDRYLCHHCSFRLEDCDFQSDPPPPDAEPCGGYILLTLLKEQGLFTPPESEDDGEDIIEDIRIVD